MKHCNECGNTLIFGEKEDICILCKSEINLVFKPKEQTLEELIKYFGPKKSKELLSFCQDLKVRIIQKGEFLTPYPNHKNPKKLVSVSEEDLQELSKFLLILLT